MADEYNTGLGWSDDVIAGSLLTDEFEEEEEEEEQEKKEEVPEEEEDESPAEDEEDDDDDDYDLDEEPVIRQRERRKETDGAPVASARNIPRPTTSLMAPPPGKIGSIWVSLVKDAYVAMSLAEIEKTNVPGESQARTPVMTVIEGILSHHGGRMSLEDLTSKIAQYWNRPFPGSPYTDEEFIYTLVSNSDHIRVEQ
jgi:hypothetical protein